MFDFMIKMLKAKTMEEYVKKERKDDFRTGLYFVLGAMAILFITGMLLTLFYNFVYDFFYAGYYEGYYEDLGRMDVVQSFVDETIGFVIGIIGSLLGLSVTYYGAKMIGGKAEYGEWFYLAGKFVFLVAVIDFLFVFPGLLPGLECVFGIAQLAWWVYALYLFIVLASTLFNIPKLSAFAALALGFIVEVVFDLAAVFALFFALGIDMGVGELLSSPEFI